MSTSTQQGFAFRPRRYFLTDLDTAVLSRIKGKARRAAVRRLGPSHADAPMVAESLSEDERAAVGRVHPSLMGGEYLPDLDALEVEIARFELESVTADVISLRARRAEGKIHYRLVDEYDTPYRIAPTNSDEPLMFGELVALINGVNSCGLPQSLREWNFENDGGNAEELEHFVKVSSEFYPQLAGYYAAEAAAWVAEKRAEHECEQESTEARFPSPETCTALLGAWEVKYPGSDEMIQEDYIERLELNRDGAFTWSPPPAWAPRTGKWMVEITPESWLKLGFEDKSGGFRWNYLVLMQMEKDGPFFLHWTRTRGDAVIFADRMFRADRPTR